MKKLFPYLYLLMIYGITILLVVCEVDPGPFVSLGLIAAAGLINIVASFRLYKENETKLLKKNAVLLVILLIPFCLMFAWFVLMVVAMSTGPIRGSLLYPLLGSVFSWFVILLPASFYLFNHLRSRKSSFLKQVLAFFPILQLIPLIFSK